MFLPPNLKQAWPFRYFIYVILEKQSSGFCNMNCVFLFSRLCLVT